MFQNTIQNNPNIRLQINNLTQAEFFELASKNPEQMNEYINKYVQEKKRYRELVTLA